MRKYTLVLATAEAGGKIQVHLTMELDYVIHFFWAKPMEGHGRPSLESVTTVHSDLQFDTKSGTELKGEDPSSPH